MSLLLNILWLVFGGIWMGLAWILAGLIMVVTIVGIPWARAAFTIASFSFLPFGRMAVDRRSVIGRSDFGTGALGVLGNVIWFLFAGWWLAIGHLVHAVVLGVTIIGLPFALQHVKLALLAVAPIGQEIVPVNARLVLKARLYSKRMAGAGRLPAPASNAATTFSATAR